MDNPRRRLGGAENLLAHILRLRLTAVAILILLFRSKAYADQGVAQAQAPRAPPRAIAQRFRHPKIVQ
jgi:hypothetical protein